MTRNEETMSVRILEFDSWSKRELFESESKRGTRLRKNTLPVYGSYWSSKTEETASCMKPKIPPTPDNSSSLKYFVHSCEVNNTSEVLFVFVSSIKAEKQNNVLLWTFLAVLYFTINIVYNFFFVERCKIRKEA